VSRPVCPHQLANFPPPSSCGDDGDDDDVCPSTHTNTKSTEYEILRDPSPGASKEQSV
jgi:hypothetical protein